jgi:hypothetical protein
MPVLLVVSQTNPPKFERRRGAPLFDEEANAEVLDAVVVDVLVADADVLDLEVADTEVADTVVERLILETALALNAVPIPCQCDKAGGSNKSMTDELSESEESRFLITSLL